MAKSFTGTLAVAAALVTTVAGCDERPKTREACVRWAMKLPDIQLDHPQRDKFTVTARKSHELPKSNPGQPRPVQADIKTWTESKARVTGSFVAFSRQEVSEDGHDGPVVSSTPDHPQYPRDTAMFDRFKKCGFMAAAPAPGKN